MKPRAPQTGDPRPDAANVGAVIVTFHPDAGVYERVRSHSDHVGATLIIDNGSTEEELAPVRRLLGEGLAEVRLNGRNLGQATALNQGMEWGERRSFPWILMLDQDTSPSSALVPNGAKVFDSHQGLPLAAIGAGWILRPGQKPECTDPRGVAVPAVITSGSLHSVAAWRSVGPFRDDFFIDYVDTEWCLRARKAGYLVARSCLPTMQHEIGNPTRHRFIYRTVQPSNHNPVRRYYITRNRIHMWRAYWRDAPRYVLFDIKASMKEMVKLVLFERDRRAKLRAVLRGVVHGIRGVTGPLPLQATGGAPSAQR